MRPFLSLVFLLAMPLTAAPLADVPMRFSGTRPVVEVRVNGQGPFLFLLDTGAAGVARIDVSLVQRLHLEAKGQQESSDAGAATHATLKQFHLARLALGDYELRGVTAYSRDYNGVSYVPHIDGILGFEFFAHVLLTLDYPAQRVRVSSGHLAASDPAMEIRDGNPYVAVRLGGRPAAVLIDSGNVRAIDMPSTTVATLRQTSYTRLIGKGRSVSGDFEIREVPVAETLAVGSTKVPLNAVTFADDFGEINAGSAFLRTFVVSFDQERLRFRLSH